MLEPAERGSCTSRGQVNARRALSRAQEKGLTDIHTHKHWPSSLTQTPAEKNTIDIKKERERETYADPASECRKRTRREKKRGIKKKEGLRGAGAEEETGDDFVVVVVVGRELGVLGAIERRAGLGQTAAGVSSRRRHGRRRRRRRRRLHR